MANNNQPPGSTDPTAQKNSFLRRTGTISKGHEYEQLMTVAACLELILDENVKDFQISTDDDAFKSFDDIVITLEYKDGTIRKSATQLKHKEDEAKLLKIATLCGENNKFSIARYCFEAQEIKETDFVYILHTNRKLDVNDQEIKLQFKLPKKNNLELTVQLCKTGPEHIYTFQIEKGKNTKICADDFEAYQRFFQKFHLKTNQDNVQKLFNKNLEKWIEYFGGTKASFDKFNEFIKRWSTRDGDLEKLDKKIVIFKLVESLLSPYIEELIFSEHENDQVVRILREAIMKFSITTFKTRNEFVKKMWLNTKSDTEIKEAGYELYLLDENQEFMETSDKMKILWHLGECPLIVKVFKESEKAINTAIGFLAKNEIIDRKLILQGEACCKENHEITLNQFETLSDLKNMDATIYKNIVTKLQLHLQGRRCNLGEIITSEGAEKILTTDYLIEMAQSNIKVCGEQESLPEFYVRRSLSRTVINLEFLKKTKSQDIIVISNSKEEASEVIKTTAGKIAKIEELLNVAGPWHELSEKCIVIQPSECTSEEFLSIRQNFPEKNCHHFKYAVEGLEWIESTGNIEELRSYIIDRVADEDELNLLQCSNRINIICAEPGLGKSTMLKYFKNSFDVHYWPLYLNSKEYVSTISDNQDIETFVISCYQNIQPIEKDLLDIFYREKKIVFLWDSIDEILEPPKRNDLYKFMKKIEDNGFKQWIASRSNIKWELEKEFKSFARNIEEFNEEQQNKYIEDRLSKKYDTKQLEIIFEKLSTNTKFLNYFNILGVPMQLAMLTELFLQRNFDFFNFPMTASKLYEYFINGKLESHFEKVKLYDEFTKETVRESYLNAYKIFGIKICVESVTADYVNKSRLDFMKKMISKTLEKLNKSDPVGLIINYGGNELSFVHQTFAEYFAALFLSDNFPTLRSLSDIYFDSGFNNVRFMLNLILCEECPAHLAVLYNDVTLLGENKDHVLEKDSIGRTALHVALSWTNGHLNLPDLTISRIFQQDHLEKLETKFKIVTFLLKYLTESQEKSVDFYDSSINVDYSQIILHAAVMSGDLEVVRFTVENYVSSVDNVNGRQETPLMFATFTGNYQIAEYLIKHKANINAVNTEGWSSLYFAASGGLMDIFTYLFENGADYNIVDCQGRSLLSKDIFVKNSVGIIEYLAKKRAQLNLFNINSPKSEIFKNYVPRTLSRILINIKFVKENANDLVLVSCLNDVKGFQSYTSKICLMNEEVGVENLNEEELTALTSKAIRGTRYHFSQEDFLNITKNLKVNCHHFKYSKGDLEWVESKESVEVLRKYQLLKENRSSPSLSSRPSFNQLKIFKDLRNVNLICADAGMGKSTLLEFFHQTSIDGYWTFPLNAMEHVKNIQENGNVEEFLTLFSKKGGRFVTDLLQILIDKKRIIFLWDSLDEFLNKSQRKNVYLFIKQVRKFGFVQWIAARCTLKTEIEKELNTFARSLEEFSEADTKNYIFERLSGTYHLRNILIVTDKIINNIQFFKSHCMYEAPILLFMLTELILKNSNVDEIFPLSLVRLYDMIVSEKYQLFSKKIHPSTKEEILESYELLAVKLYFQDILEANFFNSVECQLIEKLLKETDPLGFVVNFNGRISFVHHTYFEYFTALFLSKYNDRVPSFKDVYFSNEFKNVRVFLDFFLAENCPAHIAVLSRDLNMLEKHIAEILNQDRGGRTAVHIALNMGQQNFEIPNINQFDLLKMPVQDPIILKVVNKIMRYLKETKQNPFSIVDKLCQIDCCTYAQGYMLHMAVTGDNIQVVRFIMESCTSAESKKDKTFSSLMLAAYIGNYEIVKYLLEKQDVNLTDTNGNTALHYSVYGNINLEVVKLLVSEGAEVNSEINRSNFPQLTPLHIAVHNCNLEVVKCLIDNEAEVNCYDASGCTPLIYATLNNQMEVAKLLIENNAQVNCSKENGWTPLMFAAEKGYLEIAKCLIDNKAEVNIPQSDGETALHVAASNNQIEVVKLLIENNAQVNCSKENGWTPLMFAAEKGYLEIAKCLIDNKAEVNIPESDVVTALHVAASNNKIEVVKLLIENNAQVNCSKENGWTPLMYAAQKGYLEIAKCLIDNKAEVNIPESDGVTALHVAASNNQIEVVKLLIENNAQVNCSKENGWTPLMYAAQKGYLEIAKCLIDNKAEVNIPESDGVTALHVAASNNKIEVVKLLIENNAQVNCSEEDGWTPLMFAALKGHLEIAKCLIDNKAEVNLSESNGVTTLHVAASNNLIEVVKLLIENNAQVNCSKENGWTPLMYAAQKGYLEIAKCLIDNKAEVNIPESDGVTALHVAASNNQIEVAKLLIENNAQVNCSEEDGWTPLMFAAQKGYLEIAKCLIDNKAEVNIPKSNGGTALHVAALNNRIEVAKLLIENNAQVNCSEENGWTPLMYAAEKGYLEIAKCLIDNKAEVNLFESNGVTTLHVAASNNQIEVVKLLIENNAQVNCSKENGWTPLMYAAEKGYLEIAKCLIDNKAEVNILQSDGVTTLHVAAANNQIEVAKLLIENNAQVNCSEEDGWTPLMFAAQKGYLEIAKCLIDNKAEVNLFESNGVTTLHVAASNNQIEVVKLLIENNAQVNCSKENGWTPLMYAAAKGYLEISKCLIDNKAEVNIPQSDGETALHVAASNNQIEVVKLLIENNAQVNCSKENGWTPLMYAAQKGYLEIAKCLIDNKAEVNIPESDGVTALHVAASNNQIEVAKLLIENNAQVNCSEEDGWTPLMFAAQKGYLEIAKCLIDNKAEVNILQSDGVTALHVAAANNQIEVAKLLIENNAQVNCSKENGWTPLMYAAEKGYLEIAKCLIDNKAEVNIPQSDGETALHVAASNNQIEVAKLLIENNAQVNCSEEDGWTPLMFAAQKGYLEIAKCLIDNKAEVNIPQSDGVTALHVAAANNQIEVAKLLIENNAQVNCSEENGWTPLMFAAAKGYLEIAKCLIDNKAEVNIPQSDGETALHVAASNNQIEVAKLLIENNAQVNCSEENGWTPLMFAAAKGYLEIAKCLIDNKAEVNLPRSDGDTPLHVAARNNQIEVVKLLIENNAQVNCSEENGWTPLMYAAQKGYLEIAKCLIDNKAEVNLPQSDGETALHVAASNNQIEVVKLLIENNAQVNCSEEDGWTPLMYAAQKGYLEIAKCLIDNKAEVNIPKSDGGTALHVAASNNQIEVVKLFIENNAQVNCSEEDGWTPLMYAAQKGYLEIAKCLIDNKAEVNIPKSNGGTALHVAALNNRIEVAKLLIENNAQVNCSEENGWTPLMYAAEKGYLEITKCLIDNKAEVNYTNKFGMTPIMLAVQQKFPALVQVLMHNSELEKFSDSGDTAFHIAINTDQFEIAQLLIGENSVFNNFHATPFAVQENLSTQPSTTFSNSVVPMSRNKDFILSSSAPLQGDIEIAKEFIDTLDDINTTNDRGDTTLHVAVYLNKLDFVQYLIEKKVDVNSSGNCGWTPLMYAAQEGYLEIVKILIENQADINKTDNSGANALHIAAWNNQNDTARLLVEKSVETHSFGSFGLTPLLIAVQRGNSSLAKCLIDRRAVIKRPVSQLESIQSLLDECQSEVNCPDSFMFTPLMWAARKGYLEIAQLLIDNQANVNVCNTTNNTPLNFAATDNKFEIVKLLVEHNANLNLASTGGWTPLWSAATEGYFHIVKYLFENGAAINDMVDRDGDTILSDAVLKNQLEISKYLMENGATVNIQTNTGDTPLHYAVRNENFDMVKLLVENGTDLRTKNHRGQTPQDLRQITEEIKIYLNQ